MNNFNELILSNFRKELEGYKENPLEKSKHWRIRYEKKVDEFKKLDNLLNFRSYKYHLSGNVGDMAYDNKRTTFTFFVEILQELGFEFVINN